jgi:TolA-binding protein
VLRLRPQDPLAREAYFNLGLSLEKQEKWEQAADTYRTLLARFPEYEGRDRVAVKVGYALQEAGRYEEAIAAYEAARPGATPEVGAEVQYWTAECLARLKDFDRAIVAFLRVGYLFPEQTMWAATSDLRAADLYVRTGKTDEARALYRRVIERYGAGSQWGAIAGEELESLGPARQ